MKILAIDCADKPCSCAVVEDNRIICEAFISIGLTHSQTLQPMLHDMLKNAQIDIGEIDRFAVSIGPGSFTGLRIGISAIKGMAFGSGKKCVGVSTLHAAAYGMVGTKGLIVAVMDARCGQVYTATFYSDGEKLTRISEDRAILLTELVEDIKRLKSEEKFSSEKVFLVGRGNEMCYNVIKTEVDDVFVAPPHLSCQRASFVALISDEYGEITAHELLPSYLRLPQAERELKAKNQAKLKKGVN